jgi:membrane protein
MHLDKELSLLAILRGDSSILGIALGRFDKISDSSYWAEFFDGRQPFKGFFTKFARIAVAAARSFSADDCAGKASSLTYYTLLSIVPVLAVAFGIAK